MTRAPTKIRRLLFIGALMLSGSGIAVLRMHRWPELTMQGGGVEPQSFSTQSLEPHDLGSGSLRNLKGNGQEPHLAGNNQGSDPSPIGDHDRATSIVSTPAAVVLKEIFDNSSRRAGARFASPLGAWHEQYLGEKKTGVWATMALGQIQEYLSSSLPREIEIVSVGCGDTVCEVQAASTSPETRQSAANSWEDLVGQSRQKSWWIADGFGDANAAILSTSDGRAALVAYFIKAPDSSRP